MGKRNIRDWSSAKAVARAARDKDYGGVLDRSTRVRISRDKHGYYNRDVDPEKAVYAIVHFSTEVIYFYPDGRVGINLHGWNTVTTKRRVHEYTAARVGSHRNVTHLHTYGASRPIDPEEEYIIDRSGITDPSGFTVKETTIVRAPRPLPKTRNTLRLPKIGDVFRSPEGVFWVVAPVSRYSRGLGLVEYLGDLRVNRAHAITRGAILDLTPLLQLTMLDWTAAERFVVEDKVQHVA
jgi:hypothetical protein